MDLEDTQAAGPSVDSARRVTTINLAEMLDREYFHGLVVGLMIGLIGAALVFGNNK